MLNKLEANTIDTYDLKSTFSYLGEEDIKDKSLKGNPVPDNIKEDGKRKGVIGKIGGIGADSNEPTRNGRRYPLELWQNVEKSEYFIEGMENRCIVGECNHPEERLDYSIPEGAIVLTKYDIQNDGKVYTEFDILDTLPGRTLKTYFDAGCKLGVSSRGLGEEIMKDGEKIIDPETYQFYCFDAVIFPAVKSARMELIESTSPKKQKLINSITSEINKCKSLDECLFIENMSKDTNLYLDEIKEAIEFKKEEFKISDCDNPEEAYKSTKDLLDEIEKLGNNKTERDIKFANYLKDRLNEYELVFKESNELNNKDNTKELAKSIVNKIDKKSHKTKEDSQLSDFLKAWLGESKENITDLFNQLKESMTDGYIGQSWNEVIDKLKKDGYEIDSAYIERPQNEEDIFLYKDGKTYVANVNKYSDGGYEILTSNIKEEKNNKIKISGPKNISDEDTPEVLDREPDENLEILAELQEEVKTKNSNIESLNKQLEQKTLTIKNLLTKIHNQDVSLQENLSTVNELKSEVSKVKSLEEEKNSLANQLQSKNEEFNILSKRYEKLQSVNKKFSNMLENLSKKYDSVSDINVSLKEKINTLEHDSNSLKFTNIKLQESIDSDKLSQKKVNTLTENINSLQNENESLKNENDILKTTNAEQQVQVEKLNTQNSKLKKQYSQSLDKYIEAICLKFNIKESTLRRLLGENYSIQEIDKIASELVENISKMNALPFTNIVPNKRIVYENVGLINDSDDNSTKELEEAFSFMVESKK